MQAVAAEQAHKVVLKGDVEAGFTRVALSAGTSAELVINTAGFVAFRADDVKSACVFGFLRPGSDFLLEPLVKLVIECARRQNILRAGFKIGGSGVYHVLVQALLAQLRLCKEFRVAAEHNIRSAACHVGGYGHCAGHTRLSDDFRLAVMVLGVEHVVRNAALFEHIAENFGFFNGDSTHEHGLIFRMSINNFVNYRAELRPLGFVNHVRQILTDNGLVGGDFHNVKAVNLAEFVNLGHSRTSHTGKLAVHTEIVLEGDSGKGAVLSCDGYALLGFNRLMQTVVVAASEHQTAGEFVDYDNLAVFYNIVNIPFHNAVGFYSLIYMVEQSHIVRVVDIFNIEVFFRLFRTAGGDGGSFCLFVNDIVRVDGIGFLLFVLLLHAHGGKSANKAVGFLIEVGGFVPSAGDNERGSGFIYEDGVHLVHYGVVKAPLNKVLFISYHVVPQVVKAELVVRAVGDVAGVGFPALVVFHSVDNKTNGKSHVAEHLAHPLGVALCQIVVDGDNVNALSGKRVQICGKGFHKGFALAGFHFGNSALMQNYAADYLNRVRAHIKNSVAGLPAGGECLRQNVVKGFSVCKALLEHRRLRAKLLLAHIAVSILQRKNLFYKGINAPDFLLGIVSEYFFNKTHYAAPFI